MTGAELAYVKGVVAGVRSRTAARYDEACNGGDQQERFYWSGIVSAYDVTLALLDEVERDGVPVGEIPRAVTVCGRCEHPTSRHDDDQGCDVLVRISPSRFGVCDCQHAVPDVRPVAAS